MAHYARFTLVWREGRPLRGLLGLSPMTEVLCTEARKRRGGFGGGQRPLHSEALIPLENHSTKCYI